MIFLFGPYAGYTLANRYKGQDSENNFSSDGELEGINLGGLDFSRQYLGGYIFNADTKITGNEVNLEDEGQGYKLGLGVKVIPFLSMSLNVEYKERDSIFLFLHSSFFQISLQ